MVFKIFESCIKKLQLFYFCCVNTDNNKIKTTPKGFLSMFSYHSRRYGKFALCFAVICLVLVMLTVAAGAQSNVDALAAEYGVTPAKTELIKQVLSAYPSKTFEELVPMTVRELNTLLDAVVPQPVEPAKESVTILSEEEAKAVAFKYAGVSAADVSQLVCKLDWDRRSVEWEIDFYCNGYKYEYDVDAQTGKVTDFSQKADKNYRDTNGVSFAPRMDASAYISEEQALAVALEHAGFRSEDVKVIYVKLDVDDGYPEYDVEFYTPDGMEYDYEIDANSGKVASFDRELDFHGKLQDFAQKISVADAVSVPAPSGEISAEEAQAIALRNAGVSSADRMKVKKDYDDGMFVYEIEFVSGTTEYEMDISAADGSVLSFDKESIFD